MPRIIVDTRQPMVDFQSGNVLSDSLYKFGSDIARAPLAAAEIRRQNEQDAVAQGFRDRQEQRSVDQDAMRNAWHTDEMAHRTMLDKRQAGLDQQSRQRQHLLDVRAGLAEPAWDGAPMGPPPPSAQHELDLAELAKGDRTLAELMRKAQIEHLQRPTGKNAPGTRPQRQQIHNFGTDIDPDVRQFDEDSGTWIKAPLAADDTPHQPTAAEIQQQNLTETGFPDRQDNWYNPADWFRHAPAGPPPGAHHGADAVASGFGDEYMGDEAQATPDAQQRALPAPLNTAPPKPIDLSGYAPDPVAAFGQRLQQERQQQDRLPAHFAELSGIRPDPSTGITLDDFTGQDDQRRAAALMRLPPPDRKRAIAALRQLGFK